MKMWAEKFYASKTWLDTREAFLQSKGYLCERCGKDGKIEAAKVVHHKTYLTPENIGNPHIALAFKNLEALCQDCHNREHHGGKEEPRYTFDDKGRVVPV